MLNNEVDKDPSADLDYVFDWSSWVESGDTINSHDITLSEIILDSSSESDGLVTAWISGGVAGTNYTIVCEITTSLGRTDQRSIIIRCVDR